jgi:hypothetical protein
MQNVENLSQADKEILPEFQKYLLERKLAPEECAQYWPKEAIGDLGTREESSSYCNAVHDLLESGPRNSQKIPCIGYLLCTLPEHIIEPKTYTGLRESLFDKHF